VPNWERIIIVAAAVVVVVGVPIAWTAFGRRRSTRLQERFAAPAEAVRDTDELVKQVMQERSYPIDNFETRAGDISVDHHRPSRTTARPTA
jgi:hypothetical protein